MLSPLLARARREALLRMKEQHPRASLYLNCRLETSTLSEGEPKAMTSIEIVAFATAVYTK